MSTNFQIFVKEFKRVTELCEQYLKLCKINHSYFDIDDVEQDFVSLELSVSYCSCCSDEIEYVNVPSYVFTDPDWKEKAKKEYQERIKKEKAKELAYKKWQEEEAAKKKEENDRKEFKRLSKLYGDE